ncbi:MAG: hypothetical protein IT357_04975, partial [Gemmatimonadaceae bacterium]|nr:hypothetical protein [Gemmatimonadaceae bacterium]
KKTRGHQAFDRLLKEVIGSDEWKESAQEARDRADLPAHMAGAYVQAIGHAGGYTVCWTSIAKEGDRGLLKYHLVFASRHMKAFAVMNDILAIQHERVERDRALIPRDVPQLLPLTAAEYDAERAQTLVRDLAASLAADESVRGRECSIEQLRLSAFPKRFGQYKLMQYAPAVTLLVDQGRATVVGEEKRRSNQLQLAVRVRI